MLATCDTGPRNVECLRMLLKAKADPNQVDHDGDPAIIRTMMRDDEAQSAALLEAGARANTTDHHGISLVQQTALTDAALQGWALGEPDFVADLQKRTQRRVSKSAAGRPVLLKK